MKTRLLLAGLVFGAWPLVQAAPLTQSTFTDVVRDVNVVTMPANSATPAKLNDLFKYPNLVRTGTDSRAELTAPDQTITRVGANTAFSFAPAGRDINLEQGSILFHSPTGKGGGTIKSGGASAAVLGTTLIVATTPVKLPTDKNGFKVIILEGNGRVSLANGRNRTLHAGQMVFVLPGAVDFGPVLDINLGKLVDGSNLVNGFGNPLASLARIKLAIQQQQQQLASGRAVDTGIPADSFPRGGLIPGYGIGALDVNTYQLGVLSPAVGATLNVLNQPGPVGANFPTPPPPNYGVVQNSPLPVIPVIQPPGPAFAP